MWPTRDIISHGSPWHRLLQFSHSSHMSCRPVLASSSVWPANQGNISLIGIGHYHSVAICHVGLFRLVHAMYTEVKTDNIIPKICAFQYVCNELVIEYSCILSWGFSIHFMLCLCKFMLTYCTTISCTFILVEGSLAAFYENKKAVVTMAMDTKHWGVMVTPFGMNTVASPW